MEITIIFMVVVAVLAVSTYIGHKQKQDRTKISEEN